MTQSTGAYINPAPKIDSYLGKTIDLVFVTAVPALTFISFSEGLPNEPLYPNGVGRCRYLVGQASTFAAQPWITIHGPTTAIERPIVPSGVQVFFEAVFNPGVTGSLGQVTYPMA